VDLSIFPRLTPSLAEAYGDRDEEKVQAITD
jgi:hypothetical protein